MRYAVMTFMFRPWLADGRITLQEMMQGFSKAGAEGVELFHREFVGEPARLQEYRKVLADCNLRCPVIDVISNLVYASEQQRQEGHDELLRGLEVCKELGASIAHVAGHKLRDGVTPEAGRTMIAEGLLAVADQARQAGITLAIENYNPSPQLVCSAADCLDVIEQTDGEVKFVFDTGNFAAVEEDPRSNFASLAPYICHCHFKDFTSVNKGADFGRGVIPNKAVAAMLREYGYDGWVALETRPREDRSPVAAVAEELPLLMSYFEQH